MTRRSNVLYLAPALVNALFLYILFASTRSSEQCSLPPSSHSSSTGHRRPGLPKLPASNNPNQRHFFQYSPSLHSSNNHLRPLSGGLGSDSSSPERKLIGHPHYSPLPKDGSTYATALSAPYPSTQQEQLYPSSSQDIITYLASLEHEETARAEQLRHALNAINPDDEISDRGFRYLLENQAAIKRVLVCLAEGVDGPSSCGENETKIALLIHPDFTSTTNGASRGEVIWGEAVIHGLRKSGYTTLIGGHRPDAMRFYAIFPELVKVIFVKIDGGINYVEDCMADSKCIYDAETNPMGIPVWKMVGFSYFGVPEERHPLGRAWVVTPIPVDGHTVIGSSIEHKCTATPYVPFEERKNQAFILSKVHSYFDRYEAAWTLDTYAHLSLTTNLSLVSVSQDDTDGRLQLPSSITTLGSLSREDFLRELSQSKVLIGIGFPLVSPTPYEALCLGVPFINPFDSTATPAQLADATSDPRTVQHRPLLAQAPPNVYNVPRWDVEGLVGAVEGALTNPMQGRFVEEMVSLKGLREKLGEVMERDWEGFSQEMDRRVERVLKGGEGERRWSGWGKGVYDGARTDGVLVGLD